MSKNNYFVEDNVIKVRPRINYGYRIIGDGNNVIFYIHGWPSSRLESYFLAKHLADKDIKIISIDRPGYANSTVQRNISFLGVAEDYKLILEKLGCKKVSVFSYSGGAPYALTLTDKLPELVKKCAIVAGAIPIRLMPSQDGLFPFFKLLLCLMPYMTEFSFSQFYKVAMWLNLKLLKFSKLRNFSLNHNGGDEIFVNRRDNWLIFKRACEEAFKNGFLGALNDAYNFNEDWGQEFSLETANVEYWHGTKDLLVPYWMAEKTAEIVKARSFHTCEGCGHFATILKHGGEVLDFLTSG